VTRDDVATNKADKTGTHCTYFVTKQQNNMKFAANTRKQLDALDKKVSEPIFASRLPFAALELFLSVPGNFFGSCSFTFTTCPALIAIVFEGNTDFGTWHALVGFMLLGNLIIWHLALSPRKDSINRSARRIFFGPITGAVAPILGVTVLAVGPLSTYARQMGYFQACAWSIGVLPTAVIKPLVARQRPASWILQGERSTQMLQTAASEKHYTNLPKLFARDAFASMPSGDTAGAMACMYPLLFLLSDSTARIFGIACIAFSCFGRVYWMAHHVGDIFVGVVTSLLACRLLQAILCNDAVCPVEWWTPLVTHGLLLSIVIFTRWLYKSQIFGTGTIRMESTATSRQGKNA
jgi:membrane-associated phospholipid phosphatase